MRTTSVPSYEAQVYALALHRWHFGQWDPVYQVGCLALSGQPISESLLLETQEGLLAFLCRASNPAHRNELHKLVEQTALYINRLA